MSISSARTVACTLACVPLALALMAGRGAAQDEHEHEKVGKGEIRVYLADKSGEPVDLEDVTATVVIEPKGGKKRILRTKLVRLEGTKKK
ncbi:MAG: hypothetical protein O7F08_14245, partial [Deltaproteobacteria bacterium]|nr:hypothetical protein [Deltaproteobacteria bacterium]